MAEWEYLSTNFALAENLRGPAKEIVEEQGLTGLVDVSIKYDKAKYDSERKLIIDIEVEKVDGSPIEYIRRKANELGIDLNKIVKEAFPEVQTKEGENGSYTS